MEKIFCSYLSVGEGTPIVLQSASADNIQKATNSFLKRNPSAVCYGYFVIGWDGGIGFQVHGMPLLYAVEESILSPDQFVELTSGGTDENQ